MKQNFLLSACVVFFCMFSSFGQNANTALSNLTAPTTINASLLPDTSNSLDLGSSAFSWKNAYLRGDLYLDGARFVSNYPGGPAINVFVGAGSGKAITKGTYNSAIGHNTLLKTTTGAHNTAAGANALYYNTSGSYNTAVGRGALYRSTTASYNTATGGFALNANTTGELNAAYGYNSLFKNTTGVYNTATGANSLYANTSGYFNTATGYGALDSNTTGAFNTAAGSFALNLSKQGSYNTAYGSEALYGNGGSYNTGTGYQALYYNGGSYNTADGGYSLNNTTTGSFNLADGFAAMYLNTTGSYNTGIGTYGLYSNKTGGGNTAVGYFADVSSSALSNATVIGYNAVATASNQVMLGNTLVTSVRAAGSVVIYSDGRFKKNVQQNVPGLEFIRQLRPLTYTYDIHSLDRYIRSDITAAKGIGDAAVMPVTEAAMTAKEKVVYTGFIAQEVEEAAGKLGYDFSGVYKPANDKDVYGLSYADFVVPLVRSVQELDEKTKKLEAENQTLKEELALLKGMIMELKNGNAGSISASYSYLEQNVPNPAGSVISIMYHAPAAAAAVQLSITNAKGQVIKTMRLSNARSGKVTLNSAMWPAGTYTYTLWADGKQLDSKKMVIAR